MNAFTNFRASRNANAMLTGRGVQNRIIKLREPLTDDEIRAVAPSVFAMEAHSSRSERFGVVPTSVILAGLRKEGFLPFMAGQSRTRDESKVGYTRHIVRLRHQSLAVDGKQVFEVALINANDGTSAYSMLPGSLRFICENGAICGESFEEIKVRHTRNAMDDVIEGAYRVIEEAPRVASMVDEFSTTMLTRDHQRVLATAAHVLRFGPDEEGEMPFNPAAPIAPERLLDIRREEDRPQDLYTVWNRIQENAIKGGQRGATINRDTGKRRKATTKAVEGIEGNTALNRALWTLQEEFAKLVRSQAA